MNFAIYIPARNVAQTLRGVFARLPVEVRSSAAEIIIVDNASTDGTREAAESLVREFNVTYLRSEKNLGYGGSQKLAYSHCLKKGHDVVIMVHGDGQYAPELAGKFLKALGPKDYGMVFGSRMSGDPLGGGMPFYRYLANIFLTKTENFFLGTKLSEFHSGYRAYKLQALRLADFETCSDDFHFDTEIIVGLVRAGIKINEFTIPTHYGKESKSISFFHSIWYGLNTIRLVVNYRIKSRNPKVPA